MARLTGSGAAYLVARYGLGVLVSIGNMLVLTWWIGPHAYGVFVMAVGLVAFLSSVARAGVDTYLVRRQPAPGPQIYHIASSLLAVISTGLLLLGAALTPLLVRWYGNPEFVAPYLFLLLSVPLTSLIGVPTAKLERNLDFRVVAKIELTGQSLGLLTSLALALLRAGVWSPVAGQTMWQVFNLAAVCRAAHLWPRLRWDRAEVRRMLTYGAGLTAAMRTWQLRNLVNPLLVGRFAGTEAVAFVAIAIRIAESLGAVRLAAGRISIAALSRLREDRDQFQAMLRRAITLQVVTLGPLLCAFLLCGRVAIRVIGVRWTPVLPIYPFIAAGVLVNSVYNLQASALFVVGRQWTVMRAYAANVGILAIATTVLLPYCGVSAYGWAELLACGAYLIIHRASGKSFPVQDRNWLPWVGLFAAFLFLPALSRQPAWLGFALSGTGGFAWSISRNRGLRPARTGTAMATVSTVCGLKAHMLVAVCIAMAPAPRLPPKLALAANRPAQPSVVGKTIPATLFGLHFRRDKIAWPAIPFGALRLWDTDTRWQNMNPAPGVYDFRTLDDYLAAAKEHGLTDILLTLSATPAWASSQPDYARCDFSATAPGDCAPPAGLNADGSGSDLYWQDFVYHLGAHLAALPALRYQTVNYFGLWNEFTRGAESARAAWLGTKPQLRRMANDANCILAGRDSLTFRCTAEAMHVPSVALLPSARILSPDAVPLSADFDRLAAYLAQPQAHSSFEIVAVHTYTQPWGRDAGPESGPAGLVSQWAAVSRLSSDLPVWSTEGGWGDTGRNLPDPDMQAGYIARYYLAGWSVGFERLYWYAADNSWGRLINQTGVGGCHPHAARTGCPTPAAAAWTKTFTWMVGNAITSACSPNSTGRVWSCGLVKPDGTKLLAVWDSSQSCSSGACTTGSFSYPPIYKCYFTLDSAAATPLAGGTVEIGWKPVLLSE